MDVVDCTEKENARWEYGKENSGGVFISLFTYMFALFETERERTRYAQR